MPPCCMCPVCLPMLLYCTILLTSATHRSAPRGALYSKDCSGSLLFLLLLTFLRLLLVLTLFERNPHVRVLGLRLGGRPVCTLWYALYTGYACLPGYTVGRAASRVHSPFIHPGDTTSTTRLSVCRQCCPSHRPEQACPFCFSRPSQENISRFIEDLG